jgi:hypothetical protein
MLHYVAPVASGVADAQKYWFVLFVGFHEGFLSPWIPVNGVVCVLEQVWALLVDESIRFGHFLFS